MVIAINLGRGLALGDIREGLEHGCNAGMGAGGMAGGLVRGASVEIDQGLEIDSCRAHVQTQVA